jgi:endonuclease/exonuclease/phosphatase family metal-dependent hydrolase
VSVRTALPWLLLVACTKLPMTWEDTEEFPTTQADTLVDADVPDTLRIMTWNLKFGGGRVDFFFDGWGERVHMTEAEVATNMDGIRALLDEQQPDILLAQEVDINSARSAYTDMFDEILQTTDYNYAAFVPVWEVDYIPENGLGHVEMGQAVFSKWPITRNTRIDLPQSADSSALVNYFWLHRAVQIVAIDLGDTSLNVVNNHPAAYALDGTKQLHLQRIFDESSALAPPVITGGDFNVIPPGSLITEGFADNAPTSTTGVQEVSYSEAEMDALLPFYDTFDPAIPLADYQAATDQEPFLTHSVSGEVFWTQKLDYLFGSEPWTGAWTLQKPGDGDPALVSDPMALSDHAPMVATMVLP